MQNVFHHGKEWLSILCNAHYIIIFQNPLDHSVVYTLAHRLNPMNKHAVIRLFLYVLFKYRYLLLDGKQDTVAEARHRSNIFNLLFRRCSVIE